MPRIAAVALAVASGRFKIYNPMQDNLVGSLSIAQREVSFLVSGKKKKTKKKKHSNIGHGWEDEAGMVLLGGLVHSNTHHGATRLPPPPLFRGKHTA